MKDRQEGLNVVIIAVIVTGSIVVVTVIAMIVVVIQLRYHMANKSGRNKTHNRTRRRYTSRNHDNNVYIYRSSFDHNSFDPHLLTSFDGYANHGDSHYSSFNHHNLDEYSFYKG